MTFSSSSPRPVLMSFQLRRAPPPPPIPRRIQLHLPIGGIGTSHDVNLADVGSNCALPVHSGVISTSDELELPGSSAVFPHSVVPRLCVSAFARGAAPLNNAPSLPPKFLSPLLPPSPRPPMPRTLSSAVAVTESAIATVATVSAAAVAAVTTSTTTHPAFPSPRVALNPLLHACLKSHDLRFSDPCAPENLEVDDASGATIFDCDSARGSFRFRIGHLGRAPIFLNAPRSTGARRADSNVGGGGGSCVAGKQHWQGLRADGGMRKTKRKLEECISSNRQGSSDSRVCGAVGTDDADADDNQLLSQRLDSVRRRRLTDDDKSGSRVDAGAKSIDASAITCQQQCAAEQDALEDSRCGICDGDESEIGNLIVFCDGPCGNCFHQLCFGISSLPTSSWFCSASCARAAYLVLQYHAPCIPNASTSPLNASCASSSLTSSSPSSSLSVLGSGGGDMTLGSRMLRQADEVSARAKLVWQRAEATLFSDDVLPELLVWCEQRCTHRRVCSAMHAFLPHPQRDVSGGGGVGGKGKYFCAGSNGPQVSACSFFIPALNARNQSPECACYCSAPTPSATSRRMSLSLTVAFDTAISGAESPFTDLVKLPVWTLSSSSASCAERLGVDLRKPVEKCGNGALNQSMSPPASHLSPFSGIGTEFAFPCDKSTALDATPYFTMRTITRACCDEFGVQSSGIDEVVGVAPDCMAFFFPPQVYESRYSDFKPINAAEDFFGFLDVDSTMALDALFALPSRAETMCKVSATAAPKLASASSTAIVMVNSGGDGKRCGRDDDSHFNSDNDLKLCNNNDDDEVCAELWTLQCELRAQCAVNEKFKQTLAARMRERARHEAVRADAVQADVEFARKYERARAMWLLRKLEGRLHMIL